MTQQELMRWALNILTREGLSGLFGNVTFTFQDGKIVTCKTERHEKPMLDKSALRE